MDRPLDVTCDIGINDVRCIKPHMVHCTQADRCSHSIDHSQTDNKQPTNKLSEAPEELKPIHQPSGYRQYRSQSQMDLVEGYTRLVTDRIHDGWSCHLVTILFSSFPVHDPHLSVA